jgi:hypothetical protein
MFALLYRIFQPRQISVRRPGAVRRRARLELEPLQDRVLPSASSIHAAVHHHVAASHHAILQSQSVHHNSASTSQNQEIELSANIQGPNGLQLEASYHSENGTNVLKVELEHAAANATYSISLDGGTTVAATLTTDANGMARTTLSNTTLQIQAGTTLTLLDANNATVAQGTFTSGENEGEGSGNESSELSVKVQTSSGLELRARFESENGTNVLKVELEHAAANATYTVSLDGGKTVAATLTTDANGEARAVVTSSTLQVQAGTVLTLLDANNATVAQGTFASGENEGEGSGTQTPALFVSLQATSGLQLQASFHTEDGTSVLRVELEHAAVNATYTVSLDGGASVVATLTTDADGNARAVVSSSTLQIQAGTVLTLLDANGATVVQGPFATKTTTGRCDD